MQARSWSICRLGAAIHYGSQIAEHEAVRTDAGMFDVSHMLVTDVAGANAKAFFRKLIANALPNSLSSAKPFIPRC